MTHLLAGSVPGKPPGNESAHLMALTLMSVFGSGGSTRRHSAGRMVGSGSPLSAGRFLWDPVGGSTAFPTWRCGLSAELRFFFGAHKDPTRECLDVLDAECEDGHVN
jgi:hypothetical protein